MKKAILLIIFLLITVSCYAADIKITAMTEDTAPTVDDLIQTVNDPAGTAVSRKVTLGNLYKGLYWIIDSGTYAAKPASPQTGELYIVTDAITAGNCGAGAGTELALCRYSGSAWEGLGGGEVSGPGASTDGEMALFDGVTGQIIKRSNTLTGIAKLTSGVVSAASDGTDYLSSTTGVLKSTFDANTILYATVDNTPLALPVAEQRVIGRVTSGAIDDLVIDDDLSTVSGSDDTLPSAKAAKAFTDGKFGTLTNAKWCTYNSGTSKVDCNEDAPAGAGDITGVLDDATGEVPVLSDAPAALVSTDTTPDVSAGTVFRTANASATTINDFDAGGGSLLDGQILMVIVNDANTTFDFTASGLEGYADDYLASNGDLMVCVYSTTDTQWHCMMSTNVITEAMLKAVNAAVDEDILTYEETTGDFEWHTTTELSLVTGPASSVDNALVRFDSTGGKTVQDYTSGAPTCGDTGSCIFTHVVNASEVDNGNCDAADTIVWASGNKQKTQLTTDGDCTITFTYPASGVGNLTLKIIQDGDATAETIHWHPEGTVKWPGGTAPNLTTTANAIDFVTCYYDGTNAYCAANLDMK